MNREEESERTLIKALPRTFFPSNRIGIVDCVIVKIQGGLLCLIYRKNQVE